MSITDNLLVESPGVFIGGLWQRPDAGWIDDINPSTGTRFGRAPNASAEQMNAAVTAARTAADAGQWAADAALRSRCLQQLGSALLERKAETVDLVRAEFGCTDNVQMLQVDGPAFMAMRGAEHAAAPYEVEMPDMYGAAGTCLLRYEPIGVVSILTPWNFPHMINTMKLAAILASGNTVVLKPSPLTPLIGLLLARIINEDTDIPPGVVNVVTTDSLDASRLLTTHSDIDMVSFTGSSAVGRTIMSTAGESMKRVLLECGGKSACVLHGELDLDGLLPRILFESITLHSGQACILNSRLLVPAELHQEVVDRLAALAEQVVIGDPSTTAATMGPLISEQHRRRVQAMVDRATADGAKLVTGGRQPDDPETGFFFQPTILDSVDPDSEIAQEEVFGPVLSVISYRDLDDAVRIANNSSYGLSGAIWSDDVAVATDVARRIRTGQITINGSAPGDAPYGGYKQSGVGRDGGLTGVRAYTETKAIGLPV